jgi:predicted esterase
MAVGYLPVEWLSVVRKLKCCIDCYYFNIDITGFSMGGALALHTAFHLNRNLGGVFALSSFLNHQSIVYESLDEKTSDALPPLKMFHGER